MELSIKNIQKAEIFASVFQHLKIFTEHINIQFYEDKLYIQGMDSAHVSIYELVIPKTWFDEYKGVTASFSIGINTNIFFKILSAREKTQEMTIQYNVANEEDRLFVLFTNGKDKNEFDRRFETPLIDISTDMLSIPEIDYQAEFTLSAVKLAAVVNQLKTFGDTMDISCSEEQITITADNHNAGKMVVVINIGELGSYAITEGEEVRLAYSLNYMSNICLFHKLAKEVEVSLSGDYPMKIKYDIEDGASMCFYLAPKMIDE
jgi:proliferating cell nuclear antigen PCNA